MSDSRQTSNHLADDNAGRADRATTWQLRTRALRFSQMPNLMGIINVTPDSFSDGGTFYAASQAIDQALKLAEQGADILDIGGESTRPYSIAVDESEELRRLQPVLREVCKRTDVPVSIDTSKPEVARMALSEGAEIINDVTGFADSEMIRVARESGAGVCAMHMRGTPQNMQDAPSYQDVVQEIRQYLIDRRNALTSAGIELSRLCLDPGIGFGKTHQHNLTLLSRCDQFLGLGCPILVGHSRKGFIAHVLGDKQCDRTAATIGVTLALARCGIQVIRVHDVIQSKQALDLFTAAGGMPSRTR